MSAQQRRLLKLFGALAPEDRETLFAFAEFLAQRPDTATQPSNVRTPQPYQRPEQESVVGAIKRLSRTYDMLDPSTLLNETSALMSAHLLQGRAAPEVIDELETLFTRHYADYRTRHTSET